MDAEYYLWQLPDGSIELLDNGDVIKWFDGTLVAVVWIASDKVQVIHC